MTFVTSTSSKAPSKPLRQDPPPDVKLRSQCESLFRSLRFWPGVKSCEAILEQFPEKDSVIQIFQLNSIQKIKLHFGELFQKAQLTRADRRFYYSVIHAFYETTLMTDAMLERIETVEKAVPALKKRLNSNFAKNLTETLKKAERLTLQMQSKGVLFTELKQIVRELKRYDLIKPYANPDDVHRICHLAKHLTQYPNRKQYRSLETDLHEIYKKLNVHRRLLVKAKELQSNLHAEKKIHKSESTPEQQLYTQYKTQFHVASMSVLWELLFEGKLKIEVFNKLLQLPMAASAVPEDQNNVLIIQFLDLFCPEFNRKTWIRHLLSKQTEQIQNWKVNLDVISQSHSNAVGAYCHTILKYCARDILEIREINYPKKEE